LLKALSCSELGGFLLTGGMTVGPIGYLSQNANRRSKQWHDEKTDQKKKRGATYDFRPTNGKESQPTPSERSIDDFLFTLGETSPKTLSEFVIHDGKNTGFVRLAVDLASLRPNRAN